MKGIVRAAIGGAGMLVAGACAPTAGTERGVCYPNDTCNDGLSCLSRVCVVDPAVATRCDEGVDPPPPKADTVPMPALLAVEPEPRAAPLPHRLHVPAAEVSEMALPQGPALAPATDRRPVVLRVWPGSVTVTVDGSLADVGRPLDLAVGVHRLTINDRCCERHSSTFVVPEGTAKRHVVAVRLALRPAEVKLSGAPRESVVVCNDRIVLRPDATNQVSLSDLVESVRCRFYPNDVRHQFTLRAGSRTVIPWPN